MMLAQYAASYVVFQDNAKITRHLRAAYSEGQLAARHDYGPLARVNSGHYDEYAYHFDCLIWGMLLSSYDSEIAQAVRNRRIIDTAATPDPLMAEGGDCQALSPLMRGDSAPAEKNMVYYENYILGHKLVAALLLQHMPPATAADILTSITYMLVGLAFMLALATPSLRRTVAPWLVILALFYGLGYFGRMVYFAPMDWGHFLFLIAVIILHRKQPRPAPIPVSMTALYGSWIAIFEFLTGGIPLAAALILLTTALSATSLSDYLKQAARNLAAFFIAAISCFAFKALLLILILPPDYMAPIASEFLHRLRGSIANEFAPAMVAFFEKRGFSREFILHSTPGNILLGLCGYAFWSKLVGLGSSLLGIAVALGSLLVLLGNACIQKARHTLNHYMIASLLAVLAVGGWFILFWNHTLVHPFFMARLLVVLPLAAAFCLLKPAKHD